MSIEKPYAGRAAIEENFNEIKITIPAKKNWFVVLFTGCWLCGWLIGETVAGRIIFGTRTETFGSAFLFVWLTLWTIGGMYVLRIFVWNIAGKEIITAGNGLLNIDKKNFFFFKARTYDLKEAKKFRIQANDFMSTLAARYSNINASANMGTINFNYGLKTVKFAGNIDETEAAHILQKLKEKHILSEINFE